MNMKQQCKSFIREIKSIKRNLRNNTNLDNYNAIYGLCCHLDYDRNLDLVDYIYNKNFIVDEEDEKNILAQNSDSIDRLRFFIGQTYRSDMYKIDGYGNLANVDDGDFEELCDELIEVVERELDEVEEM